MASLFKLDGVWCIEANRKRLRLGKNKAVAATVFRHLENLIEATKYGIQPDAETKAWLLNLPNLGMKEKIRGMGIHVREASTVADLVELIGGNPSASGASGLKGRTGKNLQSFFGDGCPLHDIDSHQSEQFKAWMAESGRLKEHKTLGHTLSEATVARRFTCARSMFRAAIKKGWITVNPFEGIKAGNQANEINAFYVTPEVAQVVLDHLPTPELQLIFALGRWAGFRLPSEAYCLKWADVNWETGTMSVTAQKTRSVRTVPIFWQLRPYLERVPQVGTYCCPTLRSWNSARRKVTEAIEAVLADHNIARWPRLLQNLRASRSTEIANTAGMGPKAESVWIGHGEVVSMKHYLMLPDSAKQVATEAPLSREN